MFVPNIHCATDDTVGEKGSGLDWSKLLMNFFYCIIMVS